VVANNKGETIFKNIIGEGKVKMADKILDVVLEMQKEMEG